MQENVGRIDRAIRFAAGPALGAFAYSVLGGRRGNALGLVAMITGALIVESAITRVCPMNHLLGIDTRTRRERDRDLERLLDIHERHAVGIAPRFRANEEPTEPAATD